MYKIGDKVRINGAEVKPILRGVVATISFIHNDNEFRVCYENNNYLVFKNEITLIETSKPQEPTVSFTAKEIESLIDVSVYSTIVYIQKNPFLLSNDDKTIKEISTNVAKKLLKSYIYNEK